MEANERQRAFLVDCCAVLGVCPRELLGKPKSEERVRQARQAAAWALREQYPELSYSALGRLLKRDHTTVIYSANTFGVALRSGAPWASALAERIAGVGYAVQGLEVPLDSLRRCQGIDLSTAVEMPLEAVGA